MLIAAFSSNLSYEKVWENAETTSVTGYIYLFNRISVQCCKPFISEKYFICYSNLSLIMVIIIIIVNCRINLY